MNPSPPRVATPTDAATVAGLLDAFTREFHTPTPGPAVLATRLRRLLTGTDVIAVLAGDPAVAVALLTLRPNVWFDGPVGLVDELYVAPAARGRGIGSALLAPGESITREPGGRPGEIPPAGAAPHAPPLSERHRHPRPPAGPNPP